MAEDSKNEEETVTDDGEDGGKEKPWYPYITKTQFEKFLSRLQSMIPDEIDRDYVRAIIRTPSMIYRFLRGVEAMGLIDAEQRPTDRLRRLVETETRKQALTEVVRDLYPALMEKMQETEGEMEDRNIVTFFRNETGMGNDSANKMKMFFKYLLSEADGQAATEPATEVEDKAATSTKAATTEAEALETEAPVAEEPAKEEEQDPEPAQEPTEGRGRGAQTRSQRGGRGGGDRPERGDRPDRGGRNSGGAAAAGASASGNGGEDRGGRGGNDREDRPERSERGGRNDRGGRGGRNERSDREERSDSDRVPSTRPLTEAQSAYLDTLKSVLRVNVDGDWDDDMIRLAFDRLERLFDRIRRG